VLAFVRPDNISVALLVHVFGAMVLVGGLVTAATAAIIGWREEGLVFRRFSTMTLFAVALPGWLIMRIGAEWTYSREQLDQLPSDPSWIGIGFTTADGGGILLLLALILGGIGLRRGAAGGWMLRVSGVLATVLIAVYVVAVWAMGGKPS
jgi:hypothetical protein